MAGWGSAGWESGWKGHGRERGVGYRERVSCYICYPNDATSYKLVRLGHVRKTVMNGVSTGKRSDWSEWSEFGPKTFDWSDCGHF